MKKQITEIAKNTAQAMRSQRPRGKQVTHGYRKELVNVGRLKVLLEVEISEGMQRLKAVDRVSGELLMNEKF